MTKNNLSFKNQPSSNKGTKNANMKHVPTKLPRTGIE